MMADEFPPGVVEFIHQHLPTMDHVEVLLFLFARPAEMHDSRAISEATRMKPVDAEGVLGVLMRAGLIRQLEGSFGAEEATPNRALIAVLAGLYNTRPVSLVRAIYSRPAPFQSFADAFRLRKEEEK
jgi:hypothetical protein